MLDGAYGRVYYVRNHELSYNTRGATASFAGPTLTYDKGGAPGGTTTVLFDECKGEYIRSWASLSGTIRNCAGGATPWGSWLTCEETLDDRIAPTAAGLQETHGWVFDVPAKRRGAPGAHQRVWAASTTKLWLSIPPPGRSTRVRTPAPRASIVMSRSAGGSCTKGASCRCCA